MFTDWGLWTCTVVFASFSLLIFFLSISFCIFQDKTEAFKCFVEGSFVFLEHLIRISFQGLFSETFSDNELILKGSVTGVQPSIEFVIVLVLIREKLVCFQLWSHLSPRFSPSFWLLLLLRSPLHLTGLKQAVANCLQLKA